MPGGSHKRIADEGEEIAWMLASTYASRYFKMPAGEIMACGGKENRARPALVQARAGALYLAAVGANMSNKALQRVTSLRGPTIRHHLRRVEDDREFKADLDQLLDSLAGRMRAGLYLAGRRVGVLPPMIEPAAVLALPPSKPAVAA